MFLIRTTASSSHPLVYYDCIFLCESELLIVAVTSSFRVDPFGHHRLRAINNSNKKERNIELDRFLKLFPVIAVLLVTLS